MLSAPRLIYDDRCAFCRRWAAWLGKKTGGRLTLVPASRALELPPEGKSPLEKSVLFESAEGEWKSGAEAVFNALAQSPGGGRGLKLYRQHILIRGLAEAVYAVVSRMRPVLSPLCDLIWGPPEGL